MFGFFFFFGGGGVQTFHWLLTDRRAPHPLPPPISANIYISHIKTDNIAKL